MNTYTKLLSEYGEISGIPNIGEKRIVFSTSYVQENITSQQSATRITEKYIKLVKRIESTADDGDKIRLKTIQVVDQEGDVSLSEEEFAVEQSFFDYTPKEDEAFYDDAILNP